MCPNPWARSLDWDCSIITTSPVPVHLPSTLPTIASTTIARPSSLTIHQPKDKRQDKITQAQTPQQRKANDKFKKAQDAKRGKPASEIKKKDDFKSPISPLWLGLLGFVVFGGLIFELLSRIFLR
ncbi:hypothetical protein N431DRAFT_472761 [Stipitochalara longipes BDJ]|nr:hypothetical protein N431DRAFT_472761 [Stipitochalara longipes BDJ]